MAGKRDDLEVVIGADLGGLAADLRKGADMLRGFARDVDRAMPKDMAPKVDASGIRGIARAAKEGGSSVRAMAADMASFATKAALTGGTLIALEMGFEGVSSALRHVKESVAMAAELEQTTLAFDVMLGSAEKAKTMVSSLRTFAAETPFNSTEVAGAGKQLLAYGIAAEQIIPTLRMLGDVSAGFGRDLPLKDLTYLYGTLFAQQRAYAVDIRQFAGRGIPIYEELAKVVGKSSDEVKDLIENGRIGRDEVTKAFIAMTSEGGRFFKMTQRQSQTLLGIWEQMTDAFDLAKIKLGQIIIEEAGLKGVARDLEGFGKRLELGIDTQGIRQTIRLAADLAKAGAQIGYEFAHAAVSVSSLAAEGIGRAFPGLQGAADGLSATLRDLQEFKINRRQMAEVALEFSRAFIIGMAQVIDWTEKTGESMKKDLLDPLTEIVKRLSQITLLAKNPTATLNLPLMTIMKEFGLLDNHKPAPKVDAPKVAPLPGNDKDVLKIYREAKKYRDLAVVQAREYEAFGGAAEPGRLEELKQRAKDWQAEIDTLVKQIGGNADDVLRALDAGKVPGRVVTPEPPKVEKPKTREEIARESFQKFNDEVMRGIAKQELDALRDKLKPFNADGLSKMATLAALGPYAPLAPAMDQAAQTRVRIQNDPRPGGHEILRSLREKYDPLAEGGQLMERKADLDDLLKRGKITPEVHALGWRDAVKEVAERVGAGAQHRLPDAVMVGSQEDARLLNAFQTGHQQQTTEDLLTQIRNILEIIRGSNSKMAEAPAPRPAGIAVPGGG